MAYSFYHTLYQGGPVNDTSFSTPVSGAPQVEKVHAENGDTLDFESFEAGEILVIV